MNFFYADFITRIGPFAFKKIKKQKKNPFKMSFFVGSRYVGLKTFFSKKNNLGLSRSKYIEN